MFITSNTSRCTRYSNIIDSEAEQRRWLSLLYGNSFRAAGRRFQLVENLSAAAQINSRQCRDTRFINVADH